MTRVSFLANNCDPDTTSHLVAVKDLNKDYTDESLRKRMSFLEKRFFLPLRVQMQNGTVTTLLVNKTSFRKRMLHPGDKARFNELLRDNPTTALARFLNSHAVDAETTQKVPMNHALATAEDCVSIEKGKAQYDFMPQLSEKSLNPETKILNEQSLDIGNSQRVTWNDKVIDSGSFKKCYAGKIVSTESGEILESCVAVLVSQCNGCQIEKWQRSVKEEVNILQQLSKCPYIVKTIASKMFEGRQYLIQEWYQRDLSTLLNERKSQGRWFQLSETVRIARQIFAAVHYLHETAGIIHCDVKEKNILCQEMPHGLHLALCDFGMSRKINETHTCSTIPYGTPGYTPPEMCEWIIQNKNQRKSTLAPISRAWDIYSLGCIIFFLIFNQKTKPLLYINKENKKRDGVNLVTNVYKKVIQYTPTTKSAGPEYHLPIQMLARSPQERPDIKTCQQQLDIITKARQLSLL